MLNLHKPTSHFISEQKGINEQIRTRLENIECLQRSITFQLYRMDGESAKIFDNHSKSAFSST